MANRLQEAYHLMRTRAGHQHWWPGESDFEICVGAILVQNTAWTNVQHAIENLKNRQVLNLTKLHALDIGVLADMIKPAGCYRVKARRLHSFTSLIVDSYDGQLHQLFELDTATARETLLKTHGIGPETADCILLYAGKQPSFVIDAYTRRIFARHQWGKPNASYSELKTLCEDNLGSENVENQIDFWQDYHAQIVQVGKEYCRTKNPRCDQCPLRDLLPVEDTNKSLELDH